MAHEQLFEGRNISAVDESAVKVMPDFWEFLAVESLLYHSCPSKAEYKHTPLYLRQMPVNLIEKGKLTSG